MSKKPKVKIAIVWWIDAMYDNDDMTSERAKSLRGCNQVTVGHLIHEDAKYIRLAMETSDTFEDWWKHVVVIPKALVTKRRIVRV